MDYKEHIARAVKYMEENLTGEIDLAACAKACGYSEYHFLRVFKEAAGLTPADYIRKRRLSEIAKRICETGEAVSEIAFRYGFNSKENFTRAFKAEHHILPTEYKAAQNSLKLYEPLSFETKPFSVTPEIVTLPGFSLTVYRSDVTSGNAARNLNATRSKAAPSPRGSISRWREKQKQKTGERKAEEREKKETGRGDD